MASKFGTYLTKLTTDQKRLVCQARLSGATYSRIKDMILEDFGISATTQTIGYFFESMSGQELVEEEHQKLRKTWRNMPLVEQTSRMKAIAVEASKLRDTLAPLDPTDEEYMGVSAEYRNYLKLLNVEDQGSKITFQTATKSPIEEALENILDKKKESNEEAEVTGSIH